MKIELFRAGKWNNISYGVEELQDIVKNNNNRKIPVTLGHDVHFWAFDNQPALGVVEKLTVENDSLCGYVVFNEEGEKLYKSGSYPNWSVGIAKDNNLVSDNNSGRWLHHLALLGASPPAVPDLRIFSKSDNLNLELFSINGENKNIELLTKNKDKKIMPDIKQKPKDVKVEDFVNVSQMEELKKQNQLLQKQVEKLEIEKHTQAKEVFKETFSKDFSKDKMEEVLSNSLCTKEVLDLFSVLLKSRRESLPTEDIDLNSNLSIEDDCDFCYKGGK
jgi:hypothetical protein